MDQDWKSKSWDAEYVYTDIRVAHLLFRSVDFPHCHQVAQVAFRASVAPVVVEFHSCLCTSSESVECLLRNFYKEDSRPFDFHNPLPCVCLSHPSPSYARATQHRASSFLRLWRVVSRSVVAFPLSRSMTSLLYPFWPYSRQDAWWTVQAVPDLLVLP